MSENMNLASAIADNFESCGREQLEAFAEMMEIDFHPNIGDENLRGRMLERIGKSLESGPIEVPAQSEDKRFEVRLPETYSSEELTALMRLNLTPDGPWQGRRRMVTVPRPDHIKGQQGYPFTWNRFQVIIPWNVKVSVPWPIWEIIRNATFFEIDQEHTRDRKGQPKVINHRIKQNRFQYADHGDDPETIHLPKSQKEQFRRIAEATEMFKGFDRSKLARICRRLGLRYRRGIETEEVREIILRSLGYDLDFLDGDDDLFASGSEAA